MAKSCKEFFMERVVLHDIEVTDDRLNELVADYETIPVNWHSTPIDCDEIRLLLREVKQFRVARTIRRSF